MPCPTKHITKAIVYSCCWQASVSRVRLGRTVGIGAAGCGKCAVALRCSAACHTSKENANCCQCIKYY